MSVCNKTCLLSKLLPIVKVSCFGPIDLKKKRVPQNILFCVPRKKERHTILERVDGEQINFHFYKKLFYSEYSKFNKQLKKWQIT